MDKLLKCEANYAPLTPITFLKRAAAAYSDRTSVIYANTHFTWRQTYDRCCCLASSLRLLLHVSKGDIVSVLAPNVPALYEMHFAVPMAGAVLNAINTRLDCRNVATILAHSEARVFFVDYQYVPVAREALKHMIEEKSPLPLVVVIDDVDSPTGVRLGELDYESLVASGDPAHEPYLPSDEWESVSLNYTSGTTSAPKGVVYSHRGAYLSTLSLLLQWGVGAEPVYLWSLPMFHCNGWTFTWGMAARGGTNVCIRSTSAAEMYGAIANHGVTHMCCAPVVFGILLDASPSDRRPIASAVQVLTGGSPPPAALLERMEGLGFHVTHAYGMTEATGPALVCEWRAEWSRRTSAEQARLKARQGISVLTLSDVDVKDPKTMASVPRDGKAMGEIVLKGSSIMKGYLKNDGGTAESFKGGWFFTGDVGVVHPDGYVEIKDRSKDVIISGGENISSVEVEAVLYRHPSVADAAVVAMPHPRWGESPCAFLVTKEGFGTRVGEEDIISYCRENMSGYMVPKKVVFVKELPRNANGKPQKNKMREMAKAFKVTEKKKSQLPHSNRNNRKPEPTEQQVLVLSRL
ncbi:putative butyrate--CoA ligase AAE11, peroxisomal [Iris pallida]|uniref:4-coumarate--CoA ligase n=1 Tax=Iris pallida TaxID=29817 RepID=A0AAX6E6M2_IRIPA|nr:putative butyrate--CoA ligase AAE11, peroxisomal [Iris pallida]